ncbi:TonB-dependent receptor [Thermaurantimonas aggregans]|uniref:TonB-dependent receptor n=1 Tax=Thermaurantimonas aggregans TaxID=2173829 RepID=UPI0023EFDAAC|nr:TonB-dependent receptor [Thermaurantimonas aggregans]MCX8149495.1 TonB-dependent receptor [Thermaurantimonas aggregans]
MRKLYFLVLFLTYFASLLNAQYATVRGRVIDKQSKESLVGVNVVIKGTTIGVSTDIDGFYEFKVPAGKHTLVCSYVGYNQQTAFIEVFGGRTYTQNFQIEESTQLLSDVQVVATKVTNTQSAVILEVKEAKQVVSGISKQQIALSQDNNAAQVMQRIPGITIVDGRFVLIRGLNERYNNVIINNTLAPSTEVDRRTFSFDLIPSGALDRMLIFKSATPELPADMAGGIIKVYTNNTVESNFDQIQYGIGYRTQTTFQPFYRSKGSSTDFLGFDTYRRLPADFPSTDRFESLPTLSPDRARFAHLLPNNFTTQEYVAAPDFSIGYTLGRVVNNGKNQFSNITAFSISQSYVHATRSFNRFLEYDTTRPNEVLPRFEFIDNIYEKNNRLSLMSNFSWLRGSKFKIQWSNLFNQIGENETNIRVGEDYIQDIGLRRHYLLGYRSRTIYITQGEVDYHLDDHQTLNLTVGFNLLNESEPDLRRFRTFLPNNSSDGKYVMITPPSSNLFDASRYFGSLFEVSSSQALNYVYKWNKPGFFQALKAGVFSDVKIRTFDSRYFSYLIPGSIPSDRKAELERLPLDQIFSNENVNPANGFVLREGTRPVDSYDASNLLTASYIGVNSEYRRFNFDYGFRYEYNIQRLDGYQGLVPVRVNNPFGNFLPMLNISYYLNEKSQLRLAYARTVNRPEFRELAPFLFYDYKLDANKVGEPGLKNAVIDNFDFRYEYYPRLGEVISIAAFYKYFDNPIEQRNIVTSELPQFTFINADYARNYGLELEFRKSLKNVVSNPILERFSFNINASYIYSIVDLGVQASAQTRVRPLQGQSPYIFNAITAYTNEKRREIISLAYNIFGERLFAIGDLNFPDIYELPRHSIDLTVSKSFKKYQIKFGIQDLLNFKYRFYQDTDRNGSPYDALDRNIFSFRRGTLINLQFTYDLR